MMSAAAAIAGQEGTAVGSMLTRDEQRAAARRLTIGDARAGLAAAGCVVVVDRADAGGRRHSC